MSVGGAAALAALVTAYAFTSARPLQFVFMFAFLAYLLSFAWSLALRKGLVVSRTGGRERALRGVPFPVKLDVENRSGLPALMLTIVDSPGVFSSDGRERIVIGLGGRMRYALEYRATCAERGRYFLGPVRVSCSDPLGLFPFTVKGIETTEVIVYPRIGSVDAPPRSGIPQGALTVKNRLYEDPTRFRSARDYVVGDDKRRINWKVSARRGELVVNEYEPTLFAPLVIGLDLVAASYPHHQRGSYIERAIEAAATLAAAAVGLRQSVGLVATEGGEKSGLLVIRPTMDALIPLLERLATIEPTASEKRGSESIAPALRCFPYRSRIAYVGPNLQEEEYALFLDLRRRGMEVEFFLLDEHRLSPRSPGGFRRFQLKESGRELV